jgi:peptide subunit release factor 1 (eRF1)
MTARTLHPPGARPTVSTDVGSLVQRLTAIPGGSHHILSCYVRLESRDRTRATYLTTKLKERVKSLRTDPAVLALGRDERLAFERDLAQVLQYLRHLRDLPHTPGLAVFACEELGLFDAVPLARVHRTRLMLDDTPWMAELVASEHEMQPILAVVIDRAHARFFEVTAMGHTELACLTAGSTRGGKFHPDRGDAPGWGEHDYHRRLEQEHHRHYANVVRQVEELLRSRPIRGVVLAGPMDHTSALARFLPDRIAGCLLGTAKLNPTAISAAELQVSALEVAEEHDRKVLRSELKALDDAVGSGWAVTGPRETLRALHRGQVRTLFVKDDLEGRGFRCAATGRLVLATGDCRNEGEAQPVRDLVDEAIEEALRQRVRVVTVADCAEAEAVDGLAATLRFR